MHRPEVGPVLALGPLPEPSGGSEPASLQFPTAFPNTSVYMCMHRTNGIDRVSGDTVSGIQWGSWNVSLVGKADLLY